jgi:putative ABC transport system substrate-binding protein
VSHATLTLACPPIRCRSERRISVPCKFFAELMVGATLISTLAVAAERSSPPRIGVLVPSLTNSPLEEGLREGLRQAGYIESQNIVIEWRRYAPADQDLLLLATDLARSSVDLIVTVGSPATQAALQATTGPVVFTVVGDPVATGFAASLAHPGGVSSERLRLGL